MYPGNLGIQKNLLLQFRDKNELWEIGAKKTYEWIREISTKNKLNKTEQEVCGVNWEKIWKQWEGIKSLKIQSIIYKYLHNAWLTGDVAMRRHMIKKIPKCPLCKNANFTRIHVITECKAMVLERNNLIVQISKNEKFRKYMLLHLDGNFNKEIYRLITEYIITIMKKCGQVIVIKK
jgi:hypothetical protein